MLAIQTAASFPELFNAARHALGSFRLSMGDHPVLSHLAALAWTSCSFPVAASPVVEIEPNGQNRNVFMKGEKVVALSLEAAKGLATHLLMPLQTAADWQGLWQAHEESLTTRLYLGTNLTPFVQQGGFDLARVRERIGQGTARGLDALLAESGEKAPEDAHSYDLFDLVPPSPPLPLPARRQEDAPGAEAAPFLDKWNQRVVCTSPAGGWSSFSRTLREMDHAFEGLQETLGVERAFVGGGLMVDINRTHHATHAPVLYQSTRHALCVGEDPTGLGFAWFSAMGERTARLRMKEGIESRAQPAIEHLLHLLQWQDNEALWESCRTEFIDHVHHHLATFGMPEIKERMNHGEEAGIIPESTLRRVLAGEGLFEGRDPVIRLRLLVEGVSKHCEDFSPPLDDAPVLALMERLDAASRTHRGETDFVRAARLLDGVPQEVHDQGLLRQAVPHRPFEAPASLLAHAGETLLSGVRVPLLAREEGFYIDNPAYPQGMERDRFEKAVLQWLDALGADWKAQSAPLSERYLGLAPKAEVQTSFRFHLPRRKVA
jgi:hypothetical protein